MNGDEEDDSLAAMGMMPQAPIPQGPTVAPTAPGTNSLADLASLAIPAIVGSVAGNTRIPGARGRFLGAVAGAGAGEEALDQRRAQAEQYQKQQQDKQYHDILMKQASASAERLQLQNQDARNKIANRDELLKGVTDPKEREKILNDPDQWVKDETLKAHRPDMIKSLSAVKGFTPEILEALDDKEMHAAQLALVEALTKGQTVHGETISVGGKDYPMVVSSDGKVTQLKDPSATTKPTIRKDFDRATGRYVDVAVNPKSGEEMWRRDAGEEKMTAQERDALRFEKVGVMQADRLMEHLEAVKPNAFKTWWEATKYTNPTLPGIIGQITGGKVGGFDPQYAEIFSNMGQLEAMLQRAMTGGRVSFELYKRLVGHLPHVGEPVELSIEKLKSLNSDKGTMKEMMGVIQGEKGYYDRMEAGTKPTPGAPSAPATAPPGPPTPGAAKEAQPEVDIPSKIEQARQAGHSDADIAAYLKGKLGVDPLQYGLGKGALDADAAALKTQYAQP